MNNVRTQSYGLSNSMEMEIQQALKGFILKQISILKIMEADDGVQAKWKMMDLVVNLKKKKKNN